MPSLLCRVLYTILLLLLLLPAGARTALGQAGPVVITSTFDTDTEDWQTVFVNRQPNPPVPTFVREPGATSGYLRAADQLEGPQWYWVAPAKFLGDRSSAYGYDLVFEQTTSDIRNPITILPSVILTGGGLSVAYPTSVLPGPEWTSIRLRLDETSGWLVGNADGSYTAAASAQDMRTVLASLSSLQIRAEYNYGPDVNALDNVILGDQAPAFVLLPLIQR